MIPKFKYVRSQALMAMYRTIPCQHCKAEDGTVCGAHSDMAQHGKGRGIKASDEFCASLCNYCHNILIHGNLLSRDAKQELWTNAFIKTVTTLTVKYGDEYLKLKGSK